ncbi:response regulator [Bradyrhizobium sp. 31Argb]|uniref:response regulator n=1 Tax=unclassified Bradyrhizobium TaxID=2631580 RepID=UPI0013EE4F20|nr:response regulator [Bradyrhizobium sp. Leo170]
MAEKPIILVIEGDSEIQQMVEEALIEGGFEPVITPSSEEAIARFKDRNAGYRALLIDISLRGRMSGWAAARQAREIDPALPIIYITAGAGHEWAVEGVPNSILLQKPFAPAQLITAVSQLLNTASPSA